MIGIYKLRDYNDNLYRGNIIRCKAKYPYEAVVDSLICESYNEDKGYTLYVNSGYKAGHRYVILPKESISKDDGYGLDRNWLLANWSNWGYFDCDIADVWVVLNNEIPTFPE